MKDRNLENEEKFLFSLFIFRMISAPMYLLYANIKKLLKIFMC
jgi:hypothetical protein